MTDAAGTNDIVTVNGGATLGGNGSIARQTTINAGGYLSPGDAAAAGGIGTLTFASDLNLANGANLVFDLTSMAAYDQIVGTNLLLAGGTVNLALNGLGSQSISEGDSFTLFTGSVQNFTNTTFNIINNTAWTGGWEVSEGSLVVTAVPEPSTYALLMLAAAGLGAHIVRRRRR